MKVGRNDPCPCGSNEKYKRCHLPKDEAARIAAAKASQPSVDGEAPVVDEVRSAAVAKALEAQKLAARAVQPAKIALKQRPRRRAV